MKKFLIPFIVILISVLIYINFLSFKSPKEGKLITQNKVYSIKDNNNLNILIYANKKTAYQDKSLIKDVFLTNKEETKKLPLEINSINGLNKYKYLDESFTCYNYSFLILSLNEHYYISDAYLFIRLNNGHENKLKVGSFDYYIDKDILNITELFGRRHDDFPSLSSVSIKFDLNEDIYIEQLYLANDIFITVKKEVKDDELITISIPKQTKIIDVLSLKIIYQINDSTYETIIPSHIFYETNENPLDYGILNNVYIIDWSS